MAPLSSMFLTGKNDHRLIDDFRTELHASDGLLMHTGAGEWIWRPLSNPAALAVSTFLDNNPRGYGLMQRDRTFEHYQDLDLAYELRPTYWVEPHEGWGEGAVQLVELPTDDETNDNIVASWRPKQELAAGASTAYGYRITALINDARLTPGARAVNTFRASPHALGASEPALAGATRFLIDFSGGDLGYYLSDPTMVEIVATTSTGRVLRTFLTPNAHVRGFRAGVDVAIDPGQSSDVRVFLRAGQKALTETWTFPWRA
jgi:glucans biosynthesis protein